MIQVSIQDVEKNISEILAKVEKTQEKVEINRGGVKIAEISPASSISSNPRLTTPPHLRAKLHEDPTTPLDPKDFPLFNEV